MRKRALFPVRVRNISPPLTVLSHLVPPVSTMKPGPQQPKEREGTISTLNVLIEALNLAKEASSITPAKAVLGSASILLAMIRVSLILILCW